ncbi:MAG: hypothetical protein JSW00_03920 [Thermoplasmata archaeon]|nr:MAG: hypothetical protein JSW00_03920 [Thermoplasmata archaeon]
MRKMLVVGIFLVLAAMVFVGPANAGSQVPFEGKFDGGNVPAVDPLERVVVSGQANQLGKYTAVIDVNMAIYEIIGWVEVAPGVFFPILRLPTTVTFTAANGDELYADMDLIGMRHMVDGNFPSFTLDGTITGGTGRFAGATGSFSGSGGQITMPGDDTDLVSGTFFDGAISTVGSNK